MSIDCATVMYWVLTGTRQGVSKASLTDKDSNIKTLNKETLFNVFIFVSICRSVERVGRFSYKGKEG